MAGHHISNLLLKSPVLRKYLLATAENEIGFGCSRIQSSLKGVFERVCNMHF